MSAYKLTIVAGPNRGTAYPIKESEVSIGRQSSNVISLDSARVSKRHCVVQLNGDEVSVRDDGSANGTFVNGVLTREKVLSPGDKIGVGEYVFELVKSGPARARGSIAPGGRGYGQLISIPTGTPGVQLDGSPAHYPSPMSSHQLPSGIGGMAPLPNYGQSPMPSSLPAQTQEIEPEDLKERLLFKFDRYFMPFFYNLAFEQQWKTICLVLFFAFLGVNLVLTVTPLIDVSRSGAIREVKQRASWMARQLVERNVQFYAAHNETRTEIGGLEHEENVKLAVLTDLDLRILAPSSRANQQLISGSEANFATKVRGAFNRGLETGRVEEVGSEMVVAVEPVKLYNPQLGKNQVVGMAVVSLDTRSLTLDWGELGIIYSTNIMISASLGLLLILILYYLTLKPFRVLNEDLDRALRGEMSQVTHEFKLEELNPLWDVINSTLQRIPSSDTNSSTTAPKVTAEDLAHGIRMLGQEAPFAIALFDATRRFVVANPHFEEVTGIREENAIGNEVMQVARDQAFIVLTADLFDKAPVGGGPVSDDFEFSGVGYHTSMAAVGVSGSPAMGWILRMEKKEE